ncbi:MULTISPECIES: Atxe2 family lasso peptide isopeptidase [Rhodanobacter]|uniref:Atxe2 family lasso peptide isopeptidase n=1 Tax=Rhodanobacter TaxID=75309 RepID=UPI0003F5BBC8|nr:MULTISPECIES: Atxe2 family lasso peptide isopeptidase [Rhodanobacter]KZC18760.1 dipeptidyl aminopeptidase [Rhodanobacter denitrificans]UJJ50966.1 Atxe2 family lasso peptide isopeptidase [Rhodanobacter denitrificans]UJM93679.1 Atxe2 family lasso peptide isopeptidase [Rhodanobacter denitrificans]UJM97210.1 Atxe2 family lasso peptide isopeptidase [Rhodanobacter denitrificans]UJN19962.1 Atxe2 family lasso peptide isopeptidase [Rhodanobacter denitrificans]
MKLLFQPLLWAAVTARLRPDPSTRKRHTRWVPAFALVLGVAVAGPSPAETISPRRLLEVTDLGNPVISPDGRYVAFRAEQASIERNTYDTTWYVQGLDGQSPPRRVSDGGVPLREYVSGLVLPSPAVWSPDGRWIYYRARLDGRVSVWRAAADGSGARAMTSDPADVRDFALSGDGQTLRYSVGATREEVIAAEESEYDHGIHVDDTVVIAAGLFRSSKLDGRPTTQRFLGDWFSTGPLLAKVPDRWKAVDLTAMTTHDLSASEPPAHTLIAADLSPDLPAAPTKIALNSGDGRIAVLMPGRTEKGLLLSRDVELAMLPDRHASRPIRCMAELCRHRHISDIQWRSGSDEILFTATDYDQGRAQSIYGWNVSTGTVRPIVISNGLVSGSQRYWDIPCALSVDTLVCVAAEADRPPRLEAIDVASGHKRILFQPNMGLEADIAATVPARLIRWKDKQGREFTGQLFEAHGARAGHPPPLFVTFYNCYGFLRGGLGDEWPLATLAEQGISALCINAIPEFRIDFVARHDQGRAAVESVVKPLSAEGRVDRARVGMGGLSYGSEVTLWTLAHSDVVSAASVSSMSVTPTYYLFNSLRGAFRSNLLKLWQLGAPDETPERWREISPVYQLGRIKAPILFQMIEQEYRMALDYALPLVRRHQADVYVFPDEPHIKFQPRHKLAVYERNVDWFRFWLQGYEDPSLVKKQQYAHWREMRDAVSARPARSGAHSGG